ncbi:MAG: hypothetical protein ACOCV8_00320 [Spirochaetota bacterium]
MSDYRRNSDNISFRLIIRIATEYINRADMLVKAANEMFTLIGDKLFNIKLSLSILKGGIEDFRNNKLDSDIYDELKNIRENLSATILYLRRVKPKIDLLGNIEGDNILYTEMSRYHLSKVEGFKKSLDIFILNIKENIINKEFNLLERISDLGLKSLNQEFISKWYNSYVMINNKGFAMLKEYRSKSIEVEKDINSYKMKYQDKLQKEGDKYVVKEESTKTKTNRAGKELDTINKNNEKPKWMDESKGDRVYYIKNKQNSENKKKKRKN